MTQKNARIVNNRQKSIMTMDVTTLPAKAGSFSVTLRKTETKLKAPSELY
jgi:hypothetical protein